MVENSSNRKSSPHNEVRHESIASQPTLQSLRDEGVSRVELGLTDIDGVMRGKYVSLDKFGSLLGDGGGFCDCVFGWDVADQLYDNARFTGWHTGFPDAQFKLIADTLRWVPGRGHAVLPRRIRRPPTAADHPLCPRTRLRACSRRRRRKASTSSSVSSTSSSCSTKRRTACARKGYRDLKPLTPGNFGYSVLRASTHSDLFTGLMDYAAALDCPLEALHCETGPGVWEGALAVTDALAAADRANLFKTFTKVFFQKRDLIATFMAKWSMKYPGQSGHCHFSFWGDDGASLFHDGKAAASDESRCSAMRSAVCAAICRSSSRCRADRQQLHAAGEGRVGADRVHVGRRKPHRGGSGDPGSPNRNVSSVACRAPMRTRISPRRRSSARRCSASSKSSNPAIPLPAMRTRWPIGWRARVDSRSTCGRPRNAWLRRGGAQVVRRCVRGPLRVEPSVGSARVHALAQRLAARALLRDHLTLRTLRGPMRIGILQTDSVRDEFQGEFGDYPAMFRAMLMASADDDADRISRLRRAARRIPGALDECDAYLITGSRESVYDDQPWIHRLAEFVRQLDAARAQAGRHLLRPSVDRARARR